MKIIHVFIEIWILCQKYEVKTLLQLKLFPMYQKYVYMLIFLLFLHINILLCFNCFITLY